MIDIVIVLRKLLKHPALARSDSRALPGALKEAANEIEQLRRLVATGDDHDEDCDYLNLTGDLTCGRAGGRTRRAAETSVLGVASDAGNRTPNDAGK